MFRLSLFINILNYLNFKNIRLLFVSIIRLFGTIYIWYKDIYRESYFKGGYNLYIQTCFKIGIICFILTEFIFFFSFFWSYFHFIFICQGEFSFSWPPILVDKINYISLPLFNTFLLLRRGITLTLSHNNLLNNLNCSYYLVMTCLLGVTFTICQIWEFYTLNYIISTSSYRSIFFIGTGFHGTHVFLGTVILLVSWVFSYKLILFENNVFFEIAAWYWHFVDIIWLLLFTEFYWWINFIYEGYISFNYSKLFFLFYKLLSRY